MNKVNSETSFNILFIFIKGKCFGFYLSARIHINLPPDFTLMIYLSIYLFTWLQQITLWINESMYKQIIK